MVAWKMPTFFNVWRLTVVHSYSKKWKVVTTKSKKNCVKLIAIWNLGQRIGPVPCLYIDLGERQEDGKMGKLVGCHLVMKMTGDR
jgi:hypothetical protein